MSKLSDALFALAKNGVLNGMQRTDIADELVALAAQAQELERDAERYRWIRTNWFEHQWPKPILRAADVETVDAAIDAAIAKGQP